MRESALFSPGPASPFSLGTRAAGLAVAFAAMRTDSRVAIPVLALAALSLLRVERRRLVLELALGAAVLALLAPSPWPCAGLAAAIAALALLAPESGLLRANGVDRYFFAQDYPGMHANVHLIVDTLDPLDRSALERAAGSLMADVPMARSFVREAVLAAERFVARRPWLAAAEVVTWAEEPLDPAGEAALLDRRFDLARRPPFRVLGAARPGGAFRLVLTWHHSAGDGTAGTVLLDRLLQRYDEHRAGRAPAPFPPEPPARRFRELLRPQGPGWIWRMVRRHVRPLDKVGVRNASLLDDEAPRPSGSRAALVTIPIEWWERLRREPREGGVTRNDVLVTAALRAADAWRRARGKPDRSFRVLLPTDLRPTLGLAPCLQNFVGVVRAEFAAEELRGPALEELVSARVKLGRDLAEAIETPVNLGVLSALLPPALFRAALKSFDNDARSFFFSFLFTHFRALPGEVREPGGVRVERMWARVAVPRQPGFGLVVVRDARQVTIALEYRDALVSEASVEDYRRLLEAEIGRRMPPPT